MSMYSDFSTSKEIKYMGSFGDYYKSITIKILLYCHKIENLIRGKGKQKIEIDHRRGFFKLILMAWERDQIYILV